MSMSSHEQISVTQDVGRMHEGQNGIRRITCESVVSVYSFAFLAIVWKEGSEVVYMAVSIDGMLCISRRR